MTTGWRFNKDINLNKENKGARKEKCITSILKTRIIISKIRRETIRSKISRKESRY